MGKVFRKAFRISGLGERKDRWAMEQDFHGDLQVNVDPHGRFRGEWVKVDRA